MTTTELRELMDKANIETPVHDWSDALEIVDATGRGIAGASDKEREYLIAAINALPALLELYDQALAMVQPIENSPESPLHQFYRRRESLSMAVYKLENTK